MQKHSKIMQQLEQNSKEQNESIAQLHKDNLTSLNKSLIDLYNTKLTQIEKDILKSNETTIENIDYELEILRVNKWYKYIGIATVSLLIGSIATVLIAKTYLFNDGTITINQKQVKVIWREK